MTAGARIRAPAQCEGINPALIPAPVWLLTQKSSSSCLGLRAPDKKGANTILANDAGARKARQPLTLTTSDAFFRWVREFGLLDALKGVPDGRQALKTRIPLPALLLGVLSMFWLGWPSLLALDDHLRHQGFLCRLLRRVGYSRPISDDTFRRGLDKLCLESLRRVLHRLCLRSLKGWGAGRFRDSALALRLRPIHAHALAARAVVAIDGHHLFQSPCQTRTCPDCLPTIVTRNGERVTEYYHMAVVAQWVGTHPALVLDFEPLRPGEGELSAAKRLIPRLAEVYGQRIGVLLADAMYDNVPFRSMAAKAGYATVIVHKDECRDPGRSGARALERRDPQRTSPDWKHVDRGSRYRVWEEDVEGRRLVEVRRTDAKGEWKTQCVTDLPASRAPAVAVGMLIEERWGIENTGFHELVGAWNLDRAYVHAGRPTAAWAFVTLALLAYNVFQLFAYRHLKLDPARPERTLQALRRDLVVTLGLLGLRGKARARAP